MLHLKNGQQLQIPIALRSELIAIDKENDDVLLTFQLTGNDIPTIEGIRIIGRSSVLNAKTIHPILEQQESGKLDIRLNASELASMPVDGYIFKLAHSDYESAMVPTKLEVKTRLPIDSSKNAHFYTTINGNLSLKIKKSVKRRSFLNRESSFFFI